MPHIVFAQSKAECEVYDKTELTSKCIHRVFSEPNLFISSEKKQNHENCQLLKRAKSVQSI